MVVDIVFQATFRHIQAPFLKLQNNLIKAEKLSRGYLGREASPGIVTAAGGGDSPNSSQGRELFLPFLLSLPAIEDVISK